jgi:hypothetical protein
VYKGKEETQVNSITDTKIEEVDFLACYTFNPNAAYDLSPARR